MNKKTKQYWLMKCEPTAFSIFDLEKSPKKTTHWEGVRNYQARNFMRDDFNIGDEAFFYHSNTDVPAIMGTVTIVKKGYPDSSQFDPKSKYYDASANPEKPRWYLVDIQHQETFSKPISIQELRKIPSLEGMMLLQTGSRLSVQPVTEKEWNTILKLSKVL